MEEIGLEKARTKLGDLVHAAQNGTTTIITRNGRPAAQLSPLSSAASRDLATDARNIGPVLRGRRGDLDRLAGWLLLEMADRLDDRAALADAMLKLAARWEAFGDGEDAQSECAAELRAALADMPHP